MSENLGRFDHHPDPAIDFCIEVEAIEAYYFDATHGIGKPGEPVRQIDDAFCRRVEAAMQFRVGGDLNAIMAKTDLRKIDAQLRLASRGKPMEGNGMTDTAQDNQNYNCACAHPSQCDQSCFARGIKPTPEMVYAWNVYAYDTPGFEPNPDQIFFSGFAAAGNDIDRWKKIGQQNYMVMREKQAEIERLEASVYRLRKALEGMLHMAPGQLSEINAACTALATTIAVERPIGVDIPRLPVGTPVVKPVGYPFPGTVVAAFHTLSGQERFVVEATGEAYAGLLHIYNGDQLRATTGGRDDA